MHILINYLLYLFYSIVYFDYYLNENMPTILVNGCNYHYEISGTGKETILFSHGLLWSGFLFHKQVEFLKNKYRVITYDHRGQGQTEVTKDGYEMDNLYKDAVQLIEKLALGAVHFVGLSMGGFVGMRLAARRPDLVKSLILLETSCQAEPNTFKYSILKSIVSFFGVRLVTQPVMNIMFGDTFLNDKSRKAEKKLFEDELNKNKKTIIRAVDGVIKRKGIEKELSNIVCPTLIMVGEEDKATIPEKARNIHKRIPQSTLVYIKNAGHSSSIEAPEAVNKAISDFLPQINH